MRLIKFDKKENNRTNSSNNVLWLIPVRFMVRMYILLLLNINSKYNKAKTKMWDNIFKNNCFQNSWWVLVCAVLIYGNDNHCKRYSYLNHNVNLICRDEIIFEKVNNWKLTYFWESKKERYYSFLCIKISYWMYPCENKIEKEEENEYNTKEWHQIDHTMAGKPHQSPCCSLWSYASLRFVISQSFKLYWDPSKLIFQNAYLF